MFKPPFDIRDAGPPVFCHRGFVHDIIMIGGSKMYFLPFHIEPDLKSGTILLHSGVLECILDKRDKKHGGNVKVGIMFRDIKPDQFGIGNP